MKLNVSQYTLGRKNNKTSNNSLGFGIKSRPQTSKLLTVLRHSGEPVESHQPIKPSKTKLKEFCLKFTGVVGIGLVCILGTAGLGGLAGKEMSKNHITLSDVLNKAKTNLTKKF